jgi:hypothetical protein
MSSLNVRLVSISTFVSASLAFTGIAQAQNLSDIPDLGGIKSLNENVQVDSSIVESPKFTGPISADVPVTVGTPNVTVESPQTHVDAPVVDVKVPIGAAQILPGAVAPGAISKGAVDIHGNTMLLHLGAIGTPLQQSNRLCGANTFSAGTGGFNVVIGLSSDDYCDRIKAQDGVKILQRATDFLATCPVFETPPTQIKLAGFLAEAQTSGGKVKKTLPTLIETSRNLCSLGEKTGGNR